MLIHIGVASLVKLKMIMDVNTECSSQTIGNYEMRINFNFKEQFKATKIFMNYMQIINQVLEQDEKILDLVEKLYTGQGPRESYRMHENRIIVAHKIIESTIANKRLDDLRPAGVLRRLDDIMRCKNFFLKHGLIVGLLEAKEDATQ